MGDVVTFEKARKVGTSPYRPIAMFTDRLTEIPSSRDTPLRTSCCLIVPAVVSEGKMKCVCVCVFENKIIGKKITGGLHCLACECDGLLPRYTVGL